MTSNRTDERRAVRPSLLVVDDEPMLASILKRLLDTDYCVVSIDNPERAWDLVRDGMRFDAIVSDLSMPRLTGKELHDRIRELDAAQAERFLLVTGGATDSETSEFIERMGDRVLHKPFCHQQLTTLIERVLRGEAEASSGNPSRKAASKNEN